METSFRQYALGERVAGRAHAVVSSLPTMADVRAYEEQDARVWSVLDSGYPRFVEHVWVRELRSFYLERVGRAGASSALVRGKAAHLALHALLEGGLWSEPVEAGLYLVGPERESDAAFFHKYIQHTGCGLSSREAEDLLVANGVRAAAVEETEFAGNAKESVLAELSRLTGAAAENIYPCASGMNAFYSAFKGIQTVQAARGRTCWLQLGWLYVDSGSVLEKYLGAGEHLERCLHSLSTEAILAKIEACGEALAAVVVECPSNPLLETADLAAIAAAVRAQGGMLLVDPTIASVYAVDVLPYADVVATSLTKYAGHKADVLAGAVIVNAESPHATGLRSGIADWQLVPYLRDFGRLARSMRDAPEKIAVMQANAARLVKFLKGHPAVKQVHASGGAAFEEIAKVKGIVVPLVSVVLKGSLERFYDAVRVMKGPSFGADCTLLCPFMYLAHYDLVRSEAGREQLRAAGIEPDLIRIAIGTEDYAELEAEIARALEASA